MCDVWNEMSFRRYMNRNNELEQELAEDNYNSNFIYRTYEEWYNDNLFSVEDIFYLNYEE